MSRTLFENIVVAAAFLGGWIGILLVDHYVVEVPDIPNTVYVLGAILFGGFFVANRNMIRNLPTVTGVLATAVVSAALAVAWLICSIFVVLWFAEGVMGWPH